MKKGVKKEAAAETIYSSEQGLLAFMMQVFSHPFLKGLFFSSPGHYSAFAWLLLVPVFKSLFSIYKVVNKPERNISLISQVGLNLLITCLVVPATALMIMGAAGVWATVAPALMIAAMGVATIYSAGVAVWNIGCAVKAAFSKADPAKKREAKTYRGHGVKHYLAKAAGHGLLACATAGIGTVLGLLTFGTFGVGAGVIGGIGGGIGVFGCVSGVAVASAMVASDVDKKRKEKRRFKDRVKEVSVRKDQNNGVSDGMHTHIHIHIQPKISKDFSLRESSLSSGEDDEAFKINLWTDDFKSILWEKFLRGGEKGDIGFKEAKEYLQDVVKELIEQLKKDQKDAHLFSKINTARENKIKGLGKLYDYLEQTNYSLVGDKGFITMVGTKSEKRFVINDKVHEGLGKNYFIANYKGIAFSPRGSNRVSRVLDAWDELLRLSSACNKQYRKKLNQADPDILDELTNGYEAEGRPGFLVMSGG